MKFFILTLGLMVLAGCSQSGDNVDNAQTETNTNQETTMTKTYEDVTELKIETTQEGSGEQVAKAGDLVAVHYTGMLTNGTKFDSSVDRGEPIEFPLGQGAVIEGWDQGIAGMKIGEKRLLMIPPSMGYGEFGTGPIPGNATLVFETELVAIK